ncbi:class I SAM-dependent methyltransferase [Halobaculum lipolyticum]|uniref:Class I SAM-dependent methyltransferase n=1 Tax=Halobaculum lipolyticum TaxID=3032001 RepID=A0ABD5WH04_9EURY|nr:class I SAM-dependent methyltransferase [Halobaculum sp. DT31]
MPDGPRFDSTAEHYARHRPGYDDAVIDHLRERFSLDGGEGGGDSGSGSSVLDLGCGTGELAVPLAPHVDEVVAVDPSPAMLDAVRARATETGVENVRTVRGDDTDVGTLDAASGPFRLTTMGRSFHWTDGAATLERVREETEPGGGVALVSDDEWLTKGTEDWQAAVYAVADEYLDDLPERTGPVAYDRTWADHLRAAGFDDVRVESVSERRELDADAVVGYVLSLSFCSPAELGADLSAFESELRSRLADVGAPFAYDRTVEVTSGIG